MIIRAKAPLRLGFAGGGTDVSPYSDEFGGAILNATIDMHAYCHIIENGGNQITIESKDYAESVSYPVAPMLPIDGKLDLYKHVYNQLIEMFNVEPRSFRLVTSSDAPYGSGLGGSSTLVVAILRCFSEWWRLPLGDYDLARLAFDIERKRANLQGGQQDQYAATFGGFNFMEFYADRVIVNPLRIRKETINELESSLLLCFTGRSRESGNIIASQIKNVASGNTSSIQAMHQVKKDAYEMKEALLTGNLRRFADLLDAGWQHKKAMEHSISNQEIDHLHQFARQHGALAGKVSGAGGGGFMMLFVDPVQKTDLKKALESKALRTYDVSFAKHGAQAWLA